MDTYRIAHDKRGWFIEVNTALPPEALLRAGKWAFKINHDRWLSMPHGDERERLGRALKDLQIGKIEQRMIAKKDEEKILFTV